MLVLSKRIVLDCFYLLIFYFDKFSTDVCRLAYAVNVNLNLSIIFTSPCGDRTAILHSHLTHTSILQFAGQRKYLRFFVFFF